MIEPFDTSQQDRAIRLLRNGFPERSAAYWHAGFAAVSARVQNGSPLGYVLVRGGRDAGVMLTFASERGAGAPPIVNLSSWYVEPEHRFAAPAMLRAILRTPAIFTDLTPTGRVQAILPHLGFQRLSDERGLVALPFVVHRQIAGARLDRFEAGAARTLPPHWRAMLSDHEALGCLCLVLTEEGAASPVILRCGSDRLGLPTAEIIFALDRAAIVRNIGLFARVLVPKGVLTLAVEYASTHPPAVPLVFRRPQARFAANTTGRAAVDPGVVDHAYSELVYLDSQPVREGALRSLRRRLTLSCAGTTTIPEILPWAI